MKFYIWVILFVGLLIVVYNIWAESGKEYGSRPVSGFFAGEIISKGEQSGKGNIIGFQPYLVPFDYCDEQHLKSALRPYFDKAKASGFLNPNSIIVFPENTGTWLVTSGEKAAVYQTDSLQQAISIIVNSNIIKFILKLVSSKAGDKIKQALFLTKAGSMAKIYEAVFSSFSKEYQVTIVAGSVILPNPSVNKNGRLKTKTGALYNASFVFGPDGKIIAQPVKKQFPGDEEKRYVTPSNDKKALLIQTSAGNLSVLLSTDIRRAQTYETREVSPDIVIVPAAATDSLWILPAAESRYMMYVFFSGKLWEKQYLGRLATAQNDSVHVYEPATPRGRIVNLWLN